MRHLSEAQAQQAPAPVEGMMNVYRGGPTLEDMVRDEMRVLLKSWLDAHLPVMVESLVRRNRTRGWPLGRLIRLRLRRSAPPRR